ncbi:MULTISPECIES: ABC transporter substrate-binding protein [Ureibacillus]|jgi:putative tryptophan/tyrosine transport system substrate-binding protein|uniref:Putative ABC transport system substrate-binding protein n=1 Tax=Ureibacillus thermosphaericus TaxID=51173 RepID=A0A840PVU9_URETH|nr:ABC transporter substrate-binding protein [Ureibacillus thermosphaericus]MBB5150097.1 putative ABC transport system substrate-binding protein [Ureibacillus thermosphaericus]NKZ30580.1 ABC transporter substrate-binding protein [Ureibacillus thermosphaericus]
MKSSMKKLSFLLFGLVLLLAACGGGGNDTSESSENNTENETTEEVKNYKIGVTQIVEHPSLNAAYQGFQDALKDAGLNVEYDYQIAQNDNSLNTQIAQNLASAGVDLIFANSTPSAQAAKNVTTEIPIVFTSVTDPVAAQLIDSIESPGANVTGTIDLHPEAIKTTVEFMKDALDVKSIGMVYNAGEQNSVAQVNQVKEIADSLGLKVEGATVSQSSEIKQAAESLIGKVDAFYIITDNTVVSALESIIQVADSNKLPLVVGEFDSVRRGGLLAFGFEYYDIGYQAGEMAAKILKGEATPADIPAEYPNTLKLVMNKDAIEKLGLEVKDEWEAELVETQQ